MNRLRLVSVAAVSAGMILIGPAASAQADENCLGAEGVAVFCVEPLGREIYGTCVYAGGDTCTPVSIPGPDFTRCSIGEDGSLLLCQII